MKIHLQKNVFFRAASADIWYDISSVSTGGIAMVKGIHNYSEIGKLRKVLVHRIGTEVDGLVPDNFERLLFDDIPYLKVAQQEHDMFVKTLRDNGA